MKWIESINTKGPWRGIFHEATWPRGSSFTSLLHLPSEVLHYRSYDNAGMRKMSAQLWNQIPSLNLARVRLSSKYHIPLHLWKLLLRDGNFPSKPARGWKFSQRSCGRSLDLGGALLGSMGGSCWGFAARQPLGGLSWLGAPPSPTSVPSSGPLQRRETRPTSCPHLYRASSTVYIHKQSLQKWKSF